MKRRLWFKRSLFLKSDVLGFCIVTSYEKLIPDFGKRLPDLVGMQISKIGNNFHGRKLLYKIVTDELMEISMYSCAKVLCLPFVSFCVVCYTTFALTEGRWLYFWADWRDINWMLISGWESEKLEIYVTCISKRFKLVCLESVFQFCPEICSHLALFSWGFLWCGIFWFFLFGWFWF